VAYLSVTEERLVSLAVCLFDGFDRLGDGSRGRRLHVVGCTYIAVENWFLVAIIRRVVPYVWGRRPRTKAAGIAWRE
jgi:hypothetical protein